MTGSEGETPDKEIIFVGDPMCSWCWGFAPVLKAMADMAAERAALTIVVGGLRFAAEPMDDADRSSIRHHWEQVHATTGQPFDFTFFDRPSFVYDTEPACRAIVLVRSAHKEAAEPFFRVLHEAFYAKNTDITDPNVLADLAEPFGVTREDFLTAFEDDRIRAATQADFVYARQLGVTGFPTVVCRERDQWAYLTIGYRPLHAVSPLLEEWLAA